jgi:UDP-N-acetylglucosamine acyltransferase
VQAALPRQVTGDSGFPYGLVDEVLDIEPGVRGRGRKLVSANEPYFVGHFPEVPVMPGVLLCEAVAQLATMVVGDDDGPVEVRDVPHARFRRPVQPGDVLDLDVRVHRDEAAWRVAGTVRADGEAVAEIEVLLAGIGGAWIHPTAVVARGADLDDGVRIGAYAIVGRHVRIGRDTRIGTHAVVDGRTTLGARNEIFPFASVGLRPQDLKYRGEPSTVRLGNDNMVREYVSINPGTEAGGMETVLGDGCLLMVGSHVGHDCRLADGVILANGVALGGHVVVEQQARIGGLAGVHQFTRIGESALCAAGAMVSLDVPPYCMAAGDRARLLGLNVVGLKRRGFSEETIRTIKRAYRILVHGDGVRREALERARATFPDSAEVCHLADFVAASERGVCRP